MGWYIKIVQNGTVMAEYDFHEGLSRVISQLTAAVMNTSLYSPTHPQELQYIDKANTALAEILQ